MVRLDVFLGYGPPQLRKSPAAIAMQVGWGAIRPFEEDVPHFLAGKEPQVL